MKHNGVCKSCGAKVIFIKDQNGTRLPLNPTRVRVYDTVATQSPKWHYKEKAVWSQKTQQPEPLLYYISHFVTCPHASSHGKSRKNQ